MRILLFLTHRAVQGEEDFKGAHDLRFRVLGALIRENLSWISKKSYISLILHCLTTRPHLIFFFLKFLFLFLREIACESGVGAEGGGEAENLMRGLNLETVRS